MNEQMPTCPMCGESMVLRTSQQTAYVGRQFYGCSTYPQCPGLISLPLAPQACPLCGDPMVLRTTLKGKNAGLQFYGCSNYPSCNGSLSIPVIPPSDPPKASKTLKFFVEIQCLSCSASAWGQIGSATGHVAAKDEFLKLHRVQKGSKIIHARATVCCWSDKPGWPILWPQVMAAQIRATEPPLIRNSPPVGGNKRSKISKKRPTRFSSLPNPPPKPEPTNPPWTPRPAKSANSMGGNVKANTPKRSRFDKWNNRF